MEIFAAIIFIILAFFLMLTPSLIMLFGLNWGAKKVSPTNNRLGRWSIVIAVLLIVPQGLNLAIERDMKQLVSQSHGDFTLDLQPKIIAVEYGTTKTPKNPTCRAECVLLLLSKNIEYYLVVQRKPDDIDPTVVAFSFKDNNDCGTVDYLNYRQLSTKLENTLRIMKLSGHCLVARNAHIQEANIFIKYDTVENPSLLTPDFTGRQLTVFHKSRETRDFIEKYREINVRYGRVFPILLPSWTFEGKNLGLGIVSRKVNHSRKGKTYCKEDWFSDFPPCHRNMRLKSVQQVLGLNVSEYTLERDGVIPKKSTRASQVSALVNTIINAKRAPTTNEWELINNFIAREQSEEPIFAKIVLDVLSNGGFPTPGVYFGVDKIDETFHSELASAVIKRIKQDVQMPIIGDTDTKQQWYNLYKIIEKLPANTLEPHFDDLVMSIPKRDYDKLYVEFFEKFGSRSLVPMLQLIQSDKRRLKSLAPTMCKMGIELSGIEEHLLEMAETRQISLSGYYGNLVYLLLGLGVDESRLIGTIDPESFQADSKISVLKKRIHRYKNGKSYCY